MVSARGVTTTIQLCIRTGRNSFSLRKRFDDSDLMISLWWVHLRPSVLFLSLPACRNVAFATRERMKAVIYRNSLWEKTKEVNNMACKCWERRTYLLKDVWPDVPGEPECVCVCVCARAHLCLSVVGCACVCFGGGMHAHVWVCVPVCGCGEGVSVSVCFYIHRRWARRCPLIPTKLAWTWTPWNRIKGIPRDVGEEMNQNLCFQLGWN